MSKTTHAASPMPMRIKCFSYPFSFQKNVHAVPRPYEKTKNRMTAKPPMLLPKEIYLNSLPFWSGMKLVVTVPAFNEERTLGKVLDGISSAVRKFKLSSEIVVVDDGSTDGTATIARKHGASVISHHRNLGLAESFRTEMKEALDRGADLILHTDADGQYDSADLPNLLNPLLEEKADL